jgi:glycosyltransferase involved in cell wall biosynthesis
MRVVFASYAYTPEFSDPAKWLERISIFTGTLSALAKENDVHSIQLINFKGSYSMDGVDYHFKKYNKAMLRFFPLGLNRDLKNLKPDVIIMQGLHCPLRIIQLRLLLGPKVKIILQHRAEKPFTGYNKIFQHWADRYVSAYLFGSKAIGMDWIKLGNLKTATKIYEVAGLSSRFYPLERNTARQWTGVSGNPVYLWAGRLNGNKNPLTVIDGFLKFTEINQQAMLYMAYQTTELLAEIKHKLAVHHNGRQVKLIGNIEHKDLLYWLNAADFLVSGSYYEGGGAVISEALSVGCIPIITAIPSFKMLTNNGDCGFLYEPGNADALLEVLKHTHRLDLQAEKEKCLLFFNNHLSFEAIGTKIQEIVSAL